MVQKAYAGIDVAFAKKKRLPVCVCTLDHGRLVPLPLASTDYPDPPIGRGNAACIQDESVESFATQTLSYLREIEAIAGVAIQSVAIDAPRTYSLGPRRACEKAMDQLKISCFTTPSHDKFIEIRAKVSRHLAAGGAQNRMPHANQLWMLVGFSLFEVLAPSYRCLEVFPQATVRILGVGNEHKSKSAGLMRQLQEIAKHTGWSYASELKAALDQCARSPLHDRLDAYMCAWISSLYPDRLKPCGSPPEDVIWVPELGRGGG